MADPHIQYVNGPNTSGTVTFTAPSAEGNLLITGIRMNSSGAAAPTPPSGWTDFYELVGPLSTGGTNGTYIAVAAKVVTAADLATTSLTWSGTSGSHRVFFVELAATDPATKEWQFQWDEVEALASSAVQLPVTAPTNTDGYALGQWLWSGSQSNARTIAPTDWNEYADDNFSGTVVGYGYLTEALIDWECSWATNDRNSKGMLFIASEGTPYTPIPPVSDAGDDATVASAVIGTLDGSQSTNVDTCEWTQVAGPSGATIADPLALATTVEMTEMGEHTFRLTVTNVDGTSTDDVVLTPDFPTSASDLVWNSTTEEWE